MATGVALTHLAPRQSWGAAIHSNLIWTKGFTPLKNLAEGQYKVRTLYRRALHLVPWLFDTYQLDSHSPSKMRRVIRNHIEKHRDVYDLHALSMLVFNGEHLLQEAAMLWSTASTIDSFFDEEKPDTRGYAERIMDDDPYPTKEEENAAFEVEYKKLVKDRAAELRAKYEGREAPPPRYIHTPSYFGPNPAFETYERQQAQQQRTAAQESDALTQQFVPDLEKVVAQKNLKLTPDNLRVLKTLKKLWADPKAREDLELQGFTPEILLARLLRQREQELEEEREEERPPQKSRAHAT